MLRHYGSVHISQLRTVFGLTRKFGVLKLTVLLHNDSYVSYVFYFSIHDHFKWFQMCAVTLLAWLSFVLVLIHVFYYVMSFSLKLIHVHSPVLFLVSCPPSFPFLS